MRSLLAVLVGGLIVGCGGPGGGPGGGGSQHWKFTATVNGKTLDLSASGSVRVLSGNHMLYVEGADFGSCQDTMTLYVPYPVQLGTQSLVAPQYDANSYRVGTASATYTDCNLAAPAGTDANHTGSVTVTRADKSCPRAPCIEATFSFSAYDSQGSGQTFTVTKGSVSNY